MAQELKEVQIREELGDILDRLNALPRDAIQDRSALKVRQEELRKALETIEIPGSDEISERWSEKAASKPSKEGKPLIPLPSDSGTPVGF